MHCSAQLAQGEASQAAGGRAGRAGRQSGQAGRRQGATQHLPLPRTHSTCASESAALPVGALGAPLLALHAGAAPRAGDWRPDRRRCPQERQLASARGGAAYQQTGHQLMVQPGTSPASPRKCGSHDYLELVNTYLSSRPNPLMNRWREGAEVHQGLENLPPRQKYGVNGRTTPPDRTLRAGCRDDQPAARVLNSVRS